jgi:hypothetical protein
MYASRIRLAFRHEQTDGDEDISGIFSDECEVYLQSFDHLEASGKDLGKYHGKGKLTPCEKSSIYHQVCNDLKVFLPCMYRQACCCVATPAGIHRTCPTALQGSVSTR